MSAPARAERSRLHGRAGASALPAATVLAAALGLGAGGAGAARAEAALPLGRPGLGEQRTTRIVAPGLTWTRIVRGASAPAPGDRWVVNVLTIDRSRPGGRLTAILANDRAVGRETVSAMAQRRGALAGVNGTYFILSGDPTGALVTAGRLVSEPVDGRTSLLVPRSATTRPTVAAPRFGGSVAIAGGRRLLDGVERLRGRVPNCGGRGGDRPTQRPVFILTCTDSSELVLLSPRFAGSTLTAAGGVETVVRGGVVSATRTAANTSIPTDGYVLSGTGDAAAFLRRNARPGARVSLDLRLAGAGAPDTYDAVVSGGPRLLTAGRTAIGALGEGFGTPGLLRAFVRARHPRTLAGVTAAGRVLLVTVDGRRPGHSVGVTLPEAAAVMRSLGARDALNLDGGGSSTMFVDGRVVNRPSDPGGERAVSSGLFVVP